MPLGHSERRKIKDFLNGKNNACPMCLTNNWELPEDLTIAPFFDIEYKRVIEGKVLPMVALICHDCGYIRQIAAAKLGLIE